MTDEPLDVAIIGAGTAGLAARDEVAKVTENYRVFDPGPLGTSCARTACMPSKALLHSAHAFHRRHAFGKMGIDGGEALRADPRRVLAETRALRDRLVSGVLGRMEEWRHTHFVPHIAVFEEDGTLRAGDSRFRPRATIIAAGSRPGLPSGWERFGSRIITSDDFFELEDLPPRVAVVGLGPVGLELGQAMARLGTEVTGFDPSPELGSLVDPAMQDRLRDALSEEMTLVQGQAEPEEGPDGAVTMRWEDGETEVDLVLAAMGRAPALEGLGLEHLGVDLAKGRATDLKAGQLNLPGTRLYFTGDAGPEPQLLHEASDEGRIAGFFAARDRDAIFRRRVPLRIVFTDPQIAVAGDGYDAETDDGVVTGSADFDETGRTLLERASGGMVRIRAEKDTARILGATILGPAAEHLAHLMAHAIDRGDTLGELLRIPVYHPTHEEVLRRALRDMLHDCAVELDELEVIRCADAPVENSRAG